jgi:hypothetical protein
MVKQWKIAVQNIIDIKIISIYRMMVKYTLETFAVIKMEEIRIHK